MMYYSTEARRSALKAISESIKKVSEIPGDVLSYSDASQIIHYLMVLEDEVQKELKREIR